MSDDKRIVRVKFDCPKLGAPALVWTVYLVRHISKTIHPSPPEEIPIDFGCANGLDCGIASQMGDTTSYKWDSCPGYAMYKELRNSYE